MGSGFRAVPLLPRPDSGRLFDENHRFTRMKQSRFNRLCRRSLVCGCLSKESRENEGGGRQKLPYGPGRDDRGWRDRMRLRRSMGQDYSSSLHQITFSGVPFTPTSMILTLPCASAPIERTTRVPSESTPSAPSPSSLSFTSTR